MANLKVLVEKPTEAKLKNWMFLPGKFGLRKSSSFDWNYDEQEICFFLEGEVTVKTPYETVSFGKGDLVTFPQGLSCTWHVKKAVRKHYKFGS